MSTVPTTYQGAGKLSADARAALSCARLVWDGLSPAMKEALRGASSWCGYVTVRWHESHQSTRLALAKRGLIINDLGRLTPLGVLVREVGTRTPKGAQ